MAQPLAIVGASACAAAASAVRAGFQPVTADLFADLDLHRIATATRISPYPEGLLDWLRAIEPPAWMYTGGLENYPELVDEMAWIAPLWGNAGDVLKEVRDPFRLAASLRDAGLLFPETCATAEGLPLDGSWLVKSHRSAGGSGVRALVSGEQGARRGEQGEGVASSSVYFQKRVAGVPCSAVYVGNGAGAVRLCLTRQLIGEAWLGASEFRYAGSIGILSVSDVVRSVAGQVGNHIAQQFSLEGLFGIDFVIEGDRVWTIEVNPRLTASVEIVERTMGISAIAAHAAGCGAVAVREDFVANTGNVHGKAILFAKCKVVISERFNAWALGESLTEPWPSLADVSPANTAIAAGRPVITVFAAGSSENDAEWQLRERVAEVEAKLYAE